LEQQQQQAQKAAQKTAQKQRLQQQLMARQQLLRVTQRQQVLWCYPRLQAWRLSRAVLSLQQCRRLL
jgi:hypothetical protein